MGLGIHALLAHDRIAQVTFASGEWRLTLDAKRWWTDRDYYTRFIERLEALSVPVTGFEIEVRADAKLVEALKFALTSSTYPYHRKSPAQGYADRLSIALDGASVDTKLPDWARIEEPLITTDYHGSTLQIGFGSTLLHRSASLERQLVRATDRTRFSIELQISPRCQKRTPRQSAFSVTARNN